MTETFWGSEDKERVVHGIFTRIAPKYDLINTVLSFNRDKYWRRFTAFQCGLHPGDHVLDVCCGSGMLSLELAKRVGPDGNVTGLDFCENMLATAERNLKLSPYGTRINLVHGSAMTLPFPDSHFACVSIGFGLRNVEDMDIALGELIRVVKPGGHVVSLELGKPNWPVFKSLYRIYFCGIVPWLGRLGVGVDGPYRYLPESWRAFPDQDEISRRFTSAGLDDVQCSNLTGGIVCVHRGRKVYSPLPSLSEERVTEAFGAN